MDMLKVRLIIDNVKRYGGYREKNILKNMIKIEYLKEDFPDYDVYKFSTGEEFFLYDFKTHRIIG